MDLIASPAELRARDLRLLAKIGLAIVPLVALRVDPSASIASADEAFLRFSAHAGPNEHLAVEVRGGIRAMLRVLRPTTAARLSALIRQRCEPGAPA